MRMFASWLKKFRIFVFILAAFLVLPISASALGQMTQPIKITNALRGQQIHQEIIAVNGEAKVISVIFTGGGQIKDWVKFYKPQDLKNLVATTTIEARNNLTMIAVFSIPADAANGEYSGVVSVTSLPAAAEKTDQSSAIMTQKIDREVTIRVSDTEAISLAASVIPRTYDLNAKESLSVRVIYDNQSNVSLSPSINFKIKNSDKTVYNVIYPYPEGEPAVNPQARHEIPALEIPTITLANGKYIASLEFMRGDKIILEKQFGFSVGLYGGSGFLSKVNLTALKNNWQEVTLALAAMVLVAAFAFSRKKFMVPEKNLEEDAE